MKYMAIMMQSGLLSNVKTGLQWLTADQAAGTAAATVDPVNALIAAAAALAAGVLIYIKRHREFR